MCVYCSVCVCVGGGGGGGGGGVVSEAYFSHPSPNHYRPCRGNYS